MVERAGRPAAVSAFGTAGVLVVTDNAPDPMRRALVGAITEAMTEWRTARDEMAAEMTTTLAPLRGAVAEVAAEVDQHKAALAPAEPSAGCWS